MQLYIDESGSDTSFALGGYLGGSEQWASFSDKWEGVLPDGIESFHMTDFENRQGPFKDLDETDRLSLIKGLLGCINDSDVVGFGSGLLMSDYEAHVPASIKGRYDKREAAYILCFTFFAMKLAEMGPFLGLSGEPTAVICDRNREMASMLANTYNHIAEKFPEMNLGGITFEDSRRFPPLQAADILAYEIQKEVGRSVTGRKHRKSLMALDTRKYITGRFDEAAIKRIVSMMDLS